MNRNAHQIIFQDVDGCLNPADGEEFGVDPLWEPSLTQIEMFKAIDRAVDASPLLHFVINTGRFEPILGNIVKHFRSPKLRYLVMEHGCVIHDRKTGTDLDLESVARACGMHQLADRCANLDTMRKLLQWYDVRGEAEMKRLYGVPMPRLDKIGNLSYAVPHGVDGEDVLTHIEALVREDFTAAELQQLEFCRSDRFIDILPGIHKMDGIELICAYLSIDLRNALAVGDFLNDLSVFEAFDQVMCPANAHPQIIDLTRSKGDSGHISAFPYGAALLDFLGSMKSTS